MKRILLVLMLSLSVFSVFAQEMPDADVLSDRDVMPDADVVSGQDAASEEDNTGRMIGGIPAKSWEDGGQDFFVMFNSNISDMVKLYNEKEDNPQGDTCLESSSFTLNNFHIPEDAIVEYAYLVWMGAVDPEQLEDPTDNEVYLSFTQTADSSVEYAQVIRAGETGRRLDDAPSFDFEGIKYTSYGAVGCSETDSGESVETKVGYFTYRVEISDFFRNIYESNRIAGHQEGSGEYYGTYTFSGLDCTDHDVYRCNTTMVSSWALVIIYRSQNIRPKKIYFYNGLGFIYGEQSVANVTGFELPNYATARLTTYFAEGDPSLFDPNLPSEEISLMGSSEDALAQGPYVLSNSCNPRVSVYTEVYNSQSSIAGWDPDSENQIECVTGGQGDFMYGVDVDTFILDSSKVANLQTHMPKGGTALDIRLSVNQDAIFTNFMVFSVDIKGSNFDIPDEDEKYFCACPAAENNTVENYYCPYVNTNRAFYYLVKIQNWGEDETGKVAISDELDPQLEYVAGTTEYATKFDANGDGTDWQVIPDKEGGKFPLSGAGYKVGDMMRRCTKTSCPDKILVRYKVRPRNGVAKNYVFSNIAVLTDSKSDAVYKTNNSYPLKLKPGRCVSETVCSSPTPEMCGGVNSQDSGDSGDSAHPGDTGDSGDSEHPGDTGDTGDTGSDTGSDTDTPSDSNQGELNGECYPDGTCGKGLLCNANNICVARPKVSDGCSALVL
ncbi:hypothetical protein J5834_04195 [bacterium]|nr:hypothetical protein [bacterium]